MANTGQCRSQSLKRWASGPLHYIPDSSKHVISLPDCHLGQGCFYRFKYRVVGNEDRLGRAVVQRQETVRERRQPKEPLSTLAGTTVMIRVLTASIRRPDVCGVATADSARQGRGRVTSKSNASKPLVSSCYRFGFTYIFSRNVKGLLA